MAVVIATYVIQFYWNLGYSISDKASDWVDFSDYVGGLISPLLTFVSLVLLIQSLNLQNQANKELRAEVKQNQINEKLRSFETYFFGLIEAQKSSFSNFKLDFPSHLGGKSLDGVCAVQELEDQIENLRNANAVDADIEQAIEVIDKDERIYNTIRIFYNIVKMTNERLANDSGFDEKTRKQQYQTLISFTEFSQLRLVMISMQFINCPASAYLKQCAEFMDVLIELGGGADLY
ncbi:hypothetical protein [Vibrio parahaemolyticus]|uniref:hypothetical protein n=1 Tax=Vibrio parahaemolyticus TaxID=670 RepID=UPI0011221807|nr:hypothetical protein [Vibrio parahaemolyticus]